MSLRYLSVLLCLFVIAGCTTLPDGPEESVNLPAQLAALKDVSQWKATGKMAIREFDEAVSANMIWKVDGENFEFRMTNLLGITLVDLVSDDKGAVLNANNKTFKDEDASALIYQVTNWDIPVTQLISWTKGLPQPGDQYTLTDKQLLDTLTPGCVECGVWNVKYSKYGEVDGVWLPHSLVLTRVDSKDVLIKIRIDRWTL